MSRCKCDWESSDTLQAPAEITPISRQEEDIINEMFRPYLIVTVKDQETKKLFCTRCRDGQTVYRPKKARKWDPLTPSNAIENYYRIRHGQVVKCPFCGAIAEVVQAGRMSACNKMWQRIQLVIFHAEPGGWLSARAVYAVKNYRGKKWEADPEIYTEAKYLFRPGCALQWRIAVVCENNAWRERMLQTKEIAEPFRPGLYGDYTKRQYAVIGLTEALPNTEMKYSAADLFAIDEEEAFGTIRYLSEYCHRPQMEMLTKLGLREILYELIYLKQSNPKMINWRAKDLQEFLRLNKQFTRMFMQSEKRSIKELMIAQILQHHTCCDCEIAKYLSTLQEPTIRDLKDFAGERFIQVVQYLRATRFHTWEWIDYIRMARDLEYDLTEKSVFMPRNLKERHDAAADTVKVKKDAIQAEKFVRRYKKLCAMYEFKGKEFSIVVPQTPDDIIAEGKQLHHCVGTYTARHAAGETTILFLRKTEHAEKPFGTIEMSAKNAAQMIQLRGEHNNNVPKEESKEFVAAWIEWIKAGSRRDSKGNPVTSAKKARATA